MIHFLPLFALFHPGMYISVMPCITFVLCIISLAW
jgi:hypothetical protein